MSSRRLRSALRQMFSGPKVYAQTPTVDTSSRVAILVRILGADFPPHAPAGTTLEQLRFILQHEPEHPGLEKRWLLYRVADPDERLALIALLDSHGQAWEEVPFVARDYLACWTDLGALPDDHHPLSEGFSLLSDDEQVQVLDYVGRAKSLYLFNSNAARNHALQRAWADAPWVFPWEGCCFLTSESWRMIRPLLVLPHLAYVTVPSAPVDDTQDLLTDLKEPPLAEGFPLLGFARHSLEPFNSNLRQTADSEADLLRRLGVPGPWQHEPTELGFWELVDATPLADRARLVQAGWAFRLPPQPTLPLDEQRQAIRLIARKTDMRLLGEALQRHSLRCWTVLDRGDTSIPGLAAIAANARAVPVLSVTDKPDTLPGTAERSYVNAVPHWQSLAGSEGAINRSGLLSQSGPLCGDVSQHYDRSRLQLMVDCVCILALDGRLNDNRASNEHAHRLVRTWFLDPATAMIPDAAYARLSAVDSSRHMLDAAIDFRDFYPLLDALTLLRQNGCFSLAEQKQLDEWFDAFLGWLATDSSDFLEQHSGSPVCTWYHLLMLAIAAYRGRRNVSAQVFDNLPGLLASQFRPDGSPRSSSAEAPLGHEHLFNLQAWAHLVVLTSALGRDLLSFRDSRGHSLQAAFAHARVHLPEPESLAADAITAQQWFQAIQAISQADAGYQAPPELPPLAEASTGLPPFWSLCRPLSMASADVLVDAPHPSAR